MCVCLRVEEEWMAFSVVRLMLFDRLIYGQLTLTDCILHDRPDRIDLGAHDPAMVSFVANDAFWHREISFYEIHLNAMDWKWTHSFFAREFASRFRFTLFKSIEIAWWSSSFGDGGGFSFYCSSRVDSLYKYKIYNHICRTRSLVSINALVLSFSLSLSSIIRFHLHFLERETKRKLCCPWFNLRANARVACCGQYVWVCFAYFVCPPCARLLMFSLVFFFLIFVFVFVVVQLKTMHLNWLCRLSHTHDFCRDFSFVLISNVDFFCTLWILYYCHWVVQHVRPEFVFFLCFRVIVTPVA